MYREIDEATKLRKEIEALKTKLLKSTCYLCMGFHVKTSGQFVFYEFDRYSLRSSAPWHSHTHRGYVETVFFGTEGETYGEAQKNMVAAAKYLAPLLTESPWPTILEWLKKNVSMDEDSSGET